MVRAVFTRPSPAHRSSASSAAAPAVQTLLIPRPLWAMPPLHLRDQLGAPLIHAVGPAVVSVATARVPVLFTPSKLPLPPAQRLALQLLTSRTNVYALLPTRCTALRLRRAGIPFARYLTLPPTLRLPAPTFQPSAASAALRRRLGLSPADRVVLAAGDSHFHARHSLAVWALSILAIAPPSMTTVPWKLLLTGQGDHVAACRKIATGIGSAAAFIFAADRLGEAPAPRFADLLPVADYVLDTAARPVDTRPLYEALAAGVPVLSAGSLSAREVLPPGGLITPATPRVIARRLLDIDNSPDQRHALQAPQQQLAARLAAQDPLTPLRDLLATLPPLTTPNAPPHPSHNHPSHNPTPNSAPAVHA